MRAVDATGAEGLFTTTINIDNHAPELVVDSPADGEVFAERLRLDGSTRDTIGVSRAGGQHHPHGGHGRAPRNPWRSRSPGRASSPRTWTSRASPPGWYNLQIEAADRAGNRSYVSRNFVKRPGARPSASRSSTPPPASAWPDRSR